MTSSVIIDELEDIVAVCGVPTTLVSGDGPELVSEHTSTFLSRLGNSPRYVHSNGMVERLERLVKERISALKPHLPFRRHLNKVLFDIHNSPHRILGASPSEALFTHPLRTRAPMVVIPRVVNPGHQLQSKAVMAADQP